MLTADQKPALASLIQTGGTSFGLCLYLYSDEKHNRKLECFGSGFSGIPCLLLLVVSILMFYGKRYKIVAPSFALYSFFVD